LQNVVVKLKVVPPVHISTGTSGSAASNAINTSVLVRDCTSTGTKTDSSTNRGSVFAVVNGNQTKESSAAIADHRYDKWSEVKSVKSPRRKKTSSADSVENQLPVNDAQLVSER